MKITTDQTRIKDFARYTDSVGYFRINDTSKVACLMQVFCDRKQVGNCYES